MKILLAEDNKSMMEVSCAMIQDAGHQVVKAYNGNQALDLYNTEHPDLIMLDIEMPEKSGIEVTKIIRSNKNDVWVPIIFLTSHDEDKYLSDGIESGGDDYISKPVSQVVLASKLKAMQRIIKMQQSLLTLTTDLSSEVNDRKAIERELQQQIVKQHLIVSLGQVAQHETSIDDILHRISISLVDVLGISICKVFELSSDKRVFKLKAGVGFDAKLLGTYALPNETGSNLSGALQSENPILIENATSDPSLHLSDHDVSSGILTSITGNDGAWGVLCLFSNENKHFTKEDTKFIHVISNIVSETIRRKTIEIQLLESKEHFSQVADSIEEMLWVTTADGNTVLYVSPAYETITGRKVHELQDNPSIWLDDIHPDDLDLVIKTFTDISKKGVPFTNIIRICRPDGEVRTVRDHGSPIYDEHGEITRIAGTVHDITQQKKSEEKLAKLNLLYEHILQSAGEGIFGLDTEGNITFINPAASKMIGYGYSYGTEEVIGQPCYQAVPHSAQSTSPYKMTDSPIYQALRDGIIHRSDEEVFWRKDNTSFPVEYVCAPIIDQDSKLSGAVIMFRDITSRKSMEMELQMAQKLEAVGQLAAGIAHEINTPAQYTGDNIRFLNDGFNDIVSVLNKFISLLDDCQNVPTLSSSISEVNETIENADLEFLLDEIPLALSQSKDGIESIAKIVIAMKEFSHPGTDEKELVDINHVIRNTVTVTRNEWKYVSKIELDLDETLPAIPCYSQKVGQVFMNLIVNAAHAISDVIDETKSEMGSIIIKSRQNGDNIEITITDTGAGIPQEIIDKIFDPFFTTKGVGKGTGQGLAIARSEIMDKHDGHLSCSSKEGEGTTFVIRLPASPIGDDLTEVLI